jgi:hypothetical protein
MIHSRIADDAHFVYAVRLHRSLFAKPTDQVIYTVYYDFIQLGRFLIGLGVGDSAYDVIAVLSLGIGGRLSCCAPAGGHIQQFGDDRTCTNINGCAKDSAARRLLEIFLIYVRLDLPLWSDTFCKDFLLEESGSGWNGYDKVALNMVLARLDLPAGGLENDLAFSAYSLAAANGVQDYAGPPRRFKQARPRVNRNLPAVRLESYIKMLHLVLVVR